MRIKIIKRLGERPIEIDADLVIAEDSAGNPVLIGCEYQPDMICTSHVTDPDFNRVLASLGIDRLVLCDYLKMPPPPDGAKLIRGPTS